MAKALFDTADYSQAQDAGRIAPDHINSEDRLRFYGEFGTWMITRNSGKDAIDLTLTTEELEAIISAYREILGKEQAEARKQVWARVA
jgi:hypothetical protein